MVFWENVKKVGIAQAGKKRGWIRRLAEKTGIHEVELGNKIRKNTNVNVHDASRIAAALDTTVEALLSDRLFPSTRDSGILQAHAVAVNNLKDLIQRYKGLLVELEDISNNAVSTEVISNSLKRERIQGENITQAGQHYYAQYAEVKIRTVEESTLHEVADAKLGSQRRETSGVVMLPSIALQDCDEISWSASSEQHMGSVQHYFVPREDVGDEVSAQTHGVFHVRGCSMIERHIDEGARVLIVWNYEPQDGKISLVYREHDDGCTLKFLVKERDAWYLHWCNGSNKKEELSTYDRVIGTYVQTLQRWHRRDLSSQTH